MLTILHTLESPVIESLGWALVHFLWQATLLAVLLAVVLLVLRKASSRVKYVVQCSVLLAMAACPAVTWCWVASTMKPDAITAAPHFEPDVPYERQNGHVEPVLEPMVTGAMGLESPIDADSIRLAPAPATSTVVPQLDQVEVPQPDQAVSWNKRLRSGVAPMLPWFVGAWLLGVLVLSLRLMVGWRIVQRLKRLAVTPADAAWQLRLKALAARLGVTHTVQLVESALIEVPTVIGWMRPMILLPVSLLTSLTPQQLEAVLAHELAHIRRHDYLVNLIQTAIETLLFYHPAVWWLSRMIRAEREHCCDDLAVNLCDDPITYVSALAAMEELRASPTLTMAASGGSLLNRIRRIALGPAHDSRRSIWWGASLIALMVIASLGVTTYIASHADDFEQKSVANTEAAETEQQAEADRPEAAAMEEFRGRVLNHLKKPVAGATVALSVVTGDRYEVRESTVATVLTDEVGEFRLSVLSSELKRNDTTSKTNLWAWTSDVETDGFGFVPLQPDQEQPIKMSLFRPMTEVVELAGMNGKPVQGTIERLNFSMGVDLILPDDLFKQVLPQPKVSGSFRILGFPIDLDEEAGEEVNDDDDEKAKSPRRAEWRSLRIQTEDRGRQVLMWHPTIRKDVPTRLLMREPERLQGRLTSLSGILPAELLKQTEIVLESHDSVPGKSNLFRTGIARVRCDSEGRFEVRDLPAGKISISLHMGNVTGWSWRTPRGTDGEPLELSSGVVTNVEIPLIRTRTVRGQIVTQSGQPLPNVELSVKHGTTHRKTRVDKGVETRSEHRVVVRTNDRGEFSVDVIPGPIFIDKSGSPGLGMLTAIRWPSDPAIALPDRGLRVDPAETPLQLPTLKLTVLTGRVIDHEQRPYKGLIIAKGAEPDESFGLNYSRKDGTFRLEGIGKPSEFKVYSIENSRYLPFETPDTETVIISHIPLILQVTPKANKVDDAGEASLPKGLEFLKPYPKLHGLSLDMTEPRFLEIVKQQELKTRKSVDGENVTHHIELGDGHSLVVTFDKNGKCSGIQRVRGEDKDSSNLSDKNTKPKRSSNPLVSALQPSDVNGPLDVDGEVLPVGMVQRLGSTRFKVPGWWRRLAFAGNDEWVWLKADNRVSVIHRESGRVVKHHQLRIGEQNLWSLTASADGSRVAVGTTDFPSDADGNCHFRVVVLSAQTTAHLQELKWKARSGELNGLSFSADGSKLLTVSHRGNARLWEVETGEMLRQQQFDGIDHVRHAALSPNAHTAVVTGLRGASMWKIAEDAAPIRLATDRCDSISFAPNGRLFAIIAHDGVRLYNAETGDLNVRLKSPEIESYSDADFGIQFTPDGKILAVPVPSHDLVELWDVETRRRLATLSVNQPRGVAISHDGRWLAAAGQDSTTTIFDLKTRQPMSKPSDGHSQEILGVRFAGVGSLVSSSVGDARLWDIKSGKQQQTLPHESKTTTVRGLAVSPDGTLIVTSGFDDTLGLWNRATGKRIFTLKGHGSSGGTRAVRFKADGSQFVSWGDDAVLRWWNAKDGSLVAAHVLDVPDYRYQAEGRNPFASAGLCAAFAPDTSSLFVAFGEMLSEFETQTGKRLRQVPISRQAGPLAVSADGRWLAAGERRHNKQGDVTSTVIVLRDRATLKAVREWMVNDPRDVVMAAIKPDRASRVSFIAENDNGMSFSPDSKFLAWSRIDAHPGIDILEVASNRLLANIPVDSACWCLEFSPDGTQIVSGHSDSTARVWDLKNPVFAVAGVAGLEFLKPYPKLHGLSLDMTEPLFLEIVKQQELKATKVGEGDKTAYRIGLGDGLSLIVMFRKDGSCRDIQRVRGEYNSVGHFSGRVTGPDGKPLSRARVFVLPWTKSVKEIGAGWAETDAEGRFEFDALDMTYSDASGRILRRQGLLIATADGFAADWMRTWGHNLGGLRTHSDPVEGEALELRLAKDDVPIYGRFLNHDGQPLAGASVKVEALMIPRGRDLDAHLKRYSQPLAEFSSPDYERELYHERVQLLPGVVSEIRTDADGRFRLSGFGRDRLVTLKVSAPSVIDTVVTVMTRDGAQASLKQDGSGASTPNGSVLHGAKFTLQLQPGRTIKGRVIDRETRQPVAGMWVGPRQNAIATPTPSLYPWITDDAGCFTIFGLSPSNAREEIAAIATPGLPYSSASVMADGKTDVVIETSHGIPFRLKLVDEQKRPVDAEVSYTDIHPNPHVAKQRDEHHWPVNRAARKVGGVYEGFVWPGPGAVLVKLPSEAAFRPARVDPKAFFAPGRADWTEEEAELNYGNTDELVISQGVYRDTLYRSDRLPQKDYAAIILVNPQQGSGTLELSAVVATNATSSRSDTQLREERPQRH